MDYEKKYKEAFERAKTLTSKCLTNRDKETMIYRLKDIETIFPELNKESEDERIRKALIYNFSLYSQPYKWGEKGIDVKDILTWLEKQGEKSIIKPYEWNDEEKCSYPSCVISKQESEDEKIKEELMQYLWDLYHKDFCPPKPTIETCNRWIAWLEKQREQKPIEWSDDLVKETLLSEVLPCFMHGGEADEVVAKLDEVMNTKVTAQPKQEWSEKDERMFHTVISDFTSFRKYGTSSLEDHFNECIDWLNSLKSRYK